MPDKCTFGATAKRGMETPTGLFASCANLPQFFRPPASRLRFAASRLRTAVYPPWRAALHLAVLILPASPQVARRGAVKSDMRGAFG